MSLDEHSDVRAITVRIRHSLIPTPKCLRYISDAFEVRRLFNVLSNAGIYFVLSNSCFGRPAIRFKRLCMLFGHICICHKSRTKRSLNAPEQQIIIVLLDAFSAFERTRSRWSGTPDRIAVSHAAHTPSLQEDGTATPAASTA